MSVVSTRQTTATKASQDGPLGDVPPSQAASADRPLPTAQRSQAAVPRRLQRYLSLADFEATARRRLPKMMYGFVAGGVETNASLRANRAAFDDYAFVPRALVDVSGRDEDHAVRPDVRRAVRLRADGRPSMAAYHGDIVLARSAAEANIPMIMSGASLIAAGGRARGRQPTLVPGLSARRNGPDHRARRSRRRAGSTRSC